ncbi:zona pellucida-like domain-containing protein 1 [Ambystoma mexicanum]|uniref:zona pellucida-like domain-containing protein 1 n=1 Tax=Ambystoma mexicanum TaxID=8296 RepID=UPI0037E79B6D
MKPLSCLLLAILIHQSNGVTYNCSDAYQRYPVNSDLTVNCGPSSIFVSINICPAVFAMQDPMHLALNGRHNNSNCLGTLDISSIPPVVTYTLPLDDTTQNACGTDIQIQEQQGIGVFSEFSSTQTVIVSGFVDTPPKAQRGYISYSTNLLYNFSCYYPLQYLINNSHIAT